MGTTKKFDQTENWMLTEAMKLFKKNWIDETKAYEAKGQNPLFTVGYIEHITDQLNTKIEGFTSARALKSIAKQKEEELLNQKK